MTLSQNFVSKALLAAAARTDEAPERTEPGSDDGAHDGAHEEEEEEQEDEDEDEVAVAVDDSDADVDGPAAVRKTVQIRAALCSNHELWSRSCDRLNQTHIDHQISMRFHVDKSTHWVDEKLEQNRAATCGVLTEHLDLKVAEPAAAVAGIAEDPVPLPVWLQQPTEAVQAAQVAGGGAAAAGG